MELDPGVYLRINEITTFTPPDFLTLSLTCSSPHYVHLAGRSLLVQEGWAESLVDSCWDAPHSYWSQVPRGNQTTLRLRSYKKPGEGPAAGRGAWFLRVVTVLEQCFSKLVSGSFPLKVCILKGCRSHLRWPSWLVHRLASLLRIKGFT